jgi:hypothetical protein
MSIRDSFLTDSLHLFVLVSFAIAQPLFGLLSRNAEFFVARRSQPLDVILFVLIVCYVPPLLFILIEGITAVLGRPVRKSMHGLIVAGLAASVILPTLRPIAGVPGSVLSAGAALFGVITALGTLRFYPVRLFLTILSPAVVIFPGLFLFYSPVSRVLFVHPAAEVADITVETAAPVVMVVFDEFALYALMNEHHQIDSVRYPNFAALARDATWFRNATTVCDSTMLAVPALLTGKYPDGVRLPTVVDHPQNLFTLLGKAYTVQGFELDTQLCPGGRCRNDRAQESIPSRIGSLLADLSVVYVHILLPADLSARVPPVTTNWIHFTPDGLLQDPQDRGQRFQQFLETISAAQEPRFYFLQSLLPHYPYIYLPSGKIYTDTHLVEGLALGTAHWGDNEGAVLQAYQRYLLQVGFVDTLLGKLVARLKTVGLYDRSLLVITADHGVSFRPKGAWRAVTKSNHCDIMPIPLFIKAPHQREGVISDRNVETIDVLPTIADLLGIRLPWSIDGRSALDTALPERTAKVIFSFASPDRPSVYGPTLEAACNAMEQQGVLFGSGTGRGGLFHIGPYPALVDRRPAEIGVTGTARVVVELDHANFYERVDLQSPFVPAYVAGRIVRNDGMTPPLDLAVAVNGTIRAVAQTVQGKGGELRFSAVVPEAAFLAGRNAVEVFVVSLEGTRPRLQFTQSAGAYTLVSANGQGEERIVAADGASIRLITHSLLGTLEAVFVSGDLVEFQGWAADVKNLELPKAILVFANGELRYAGRTGVARPDVAAHFGKPALQEAGFSYTFPLQLSAGGDNLEIRVFAVSKKGVASELSYPAGYRWREKPLSLDLGEPLKQKRFLEHGIRIPVVDTNEPRIGADTSKDLGRVIGEMADRWRKNSSSLRIPVVETNEPGIGADTSKDLGRVIGEMADRWRKNSSSLRIPVVETNEPGIGADTSENLERAGEMADRSDHRGARGRAP